MGCDIHSVGQVRKNGKWKTVLQDVGGDDRSYDTFAVLANVRNGYGFAGCDTGDGFIPIAEPRGLPDDFRVDSGEHHVIEVGTPTGDDLAWANEKYRTSRTAELLNSEEVWMGDHSHSYHTLSQIEEYIEKHGNKNTRKRGFVTEEAYLKLRGTNEWPEGWSGGIGGGNILALSEREYEKLANQKKLPKDKEIYVQYEWSPNYLDSTNMDKVVEQLRALAKLYEVGPDDVRMVFGFDS